MRSALNHWLWPEYEAACRKAGIDASSDPMAFWDWVSSPASVKADGGSSSSHAADFRPNQRGALSVDEVVRAVHAEFGHDRPRGSEGGAVDLNAARDTKSDTGKWPTQTMSIDDVARAVSAEAREGRI